MQLKFVLPVLAALVPFVVSTSVVRSSSLNCKSTEFEYVFSSFFLLYYLTRPLGTKKKTAVSPLAARRLHQLHPRTPSALLLAITGSQSRAAAFLVTPHLRTILRLSAPRTGHGVRVSTVALTPPLPPLCQAIRPASQAQAMVAITNALRTKPAPPFAPLVSMLAPFPL